MTSTTAFDWSLVAGAWDEKRNHVAGMGVPVTDDILSHLQLRPGERVLELGGGTGEFALELAGAVGTEGRVIASDVAAGMVALIERTAAGHENLEVRQLDAAAIDLSDASVDVVVFRMGLMFVEHPDQAAREIRRVLAPGGRAVIAVWAGPEHNPWLSAAGMAAMMNGVGAGGPPTGPGGIFSLADPAVLERTVGDAGFSSVDVHEVPIEVRFPTTDEHFNTVAALAGPLSVALARASDEARAAVRRTAADLAKPYQTADGLVLPGRALVCVATV